MKQDQTQGTSDARYIFILFGLVFVVLFFAFLIYFIYGQKQFAYREGTQDDIPTVTLSDVDTQVKDVPEQAPAKDTVPATTNQPSPTTVVPPPVTPTSSAILARYNPRSADTLRLQ